MSNATGGQEHSFEEVLRALARARMDADVWAWLETSSEQLGDPPDRKRFCIAFARTGRMLGDAHLALSSQEQDALRVAGIDEFCEHFNLRDLGRTVLLRRVLTKLRPSEHLSWVEHLFRTGELGEQQSLLRMLMLLPDPERFCPVAAEATRSNALQVFAALACENPYAANYLPELNFNQMVMKAIFSEIPVLRIRGLAQRVNPELVRMARDYANERRAAGRSIPPDIELIEKMLEDQP